MAPASPKSPAELSAQDAGGGPKKRRRTALACEECRERKRKCDGCKPVCGACAKRAPQVCSWNDERNNSNSYVAELKARIRELEAAQRSTSEASHSITQPIRPEAEPSRPAWTRTAADDAGMYGQDGENLNFAPASAIEETSVSESGSVAAWGTDGWRDKHTIAQSPISDHPKSMAEASTLDDEDEAGVDAMGIVVGAVGNAQSVRNRRYSDYFGPSSTVSLLGKARRAMSKHSGGSDSNLEESTSIRSMSRPQGARERTSSFHSSMFEWSVPLRAEADSLVESYWAWVHTLYPFVHRTSFERRYLRIWNSTSEVPALGIEKGTGCYDNIGDQLYYCMLNMVFAMGALFNAKIDRHERALVSRSFFLRAKKYLDLDLLADGSISLVQTLLLMGQYLQSTDLSSFCWNIVGLATRVAQGIGLHHEFRAGHEDQVDSEMRRRTWTGCVLLDRVLSLTLGRPLMIHPTMTKKLTLPAAIDDEFLSKARQSPGSQPDGLPSLTECYVQAIKLQNILGQILATSYYTGGDKGDENDAEANPEIGFASRLGDNISSSDLQMLFNTDGLLTSWHRQLPTQLKVQTYRGSASLDSLHGTDSNRTKRYRRQATVLQARFLHVRLTMLRPILSVVCDMARQKPSVLADADSIDEGMHSGMRLKAANTCVSVALELVNLICENAPSKVDFLPAPWYCVFYIHSCAIVLIIGYICTPEYIDCVDRTSLKVHYMRCLTFLKGYESRSQSARRCRKILELLEDGVFNSTEATAVQMAGASESRQFTHIRNFTSGMMPSDEMNQGFLNREDLLSVPSIDGNWLGQDANWMYNSSDMDWLSFAPFQQNS